VLDEIEAGVSGGEPAGGKRHQHFLLSRREDEVLRLVAAGLSNKQIAQRLIVTQNTVKSHVTSLFNKLGVDSRAQAVAVAAHLGLLQEATTHP
jgi:ATP/maltotriose-dependent transcriptional regulator MalT